MKMKIPLTGTNVVNPLAGFEKEIINTTKAEAAGQYDVQRDIVRESTVSDAGFVAPEERERRVGMDRNEKSLHRTRLGKSIAAHIAPTEVEPVWDERHGKVAFNRVARPVEQPVAPPSPYDGLSQQISSLKESVSHMAENVLNGGGQQAPGGEQAPDPLNYDLYDEESAAKFKADHSAYTQRQIEARVQATLAPHSEQIEQFKREREYDLCVEQFGDDPNFKQVMSAALTLVAENPELTIQKAYRQANNPDGAKLGQRGNAHLPKQLKGITGLGRMIAHNYQSGRAGRRR